MAKQKLTKKVVKKLVNNKGLFISADLDFNKNAPDEVKNQIPEGATYFEGIVSDGELNRNGYRIEPKALVNAWPAFKKNPVILLQHDTDQPIGNALDAKLLEGKGVWVSGFVYDELTGNRFSKGLFKALSTGHMTEAAEFENQKTGERKTRDEFFKLPSEERMNDDWNMVVTKLDWVEFSVVAIGSNRKALVTKKNVIDFYLKNGYISEDAIAEMAKNQAGDDSEPEQPEEKAVEDEEPQEQEPTEAESEDEEKEKEPEEKEDAQADDENNEKEQEDEPEKSDENSDAEGEGAEKSDEPTDGEPESSTEVKGDKIKIKAEDRARLKVGAVLLNKALENTFSEEDKPDESQEQPNDSQEAEGSETGEGEGEGEAKTEPGEKKEDDIQNYLTNNPEKVKSVFASLVSEINRLNEKVKELETKLDVTPNRKAGVLGNGVNTVSSKPKQDNDASEIVAELLQNTARG